MNIALGVFATLGAILMAALGVLIATDDFGTWRDKLPFAVFEFLLSAGLALVAAGCFIGGR